MMALATERGKKLFVTGATGYIGAHFVKAAMTAGHEIVALLRVPGMAPRIAWPKAPRWIDGTFDDVTTEQLRGCGVLVHFAAIGVSPQIASCRFG
jgi:nucleoside-diphosphate-sugar epimerase